MANIFSRVDDVITKSQEKVAGRRCLGGKWFASATSFMQPIRRGFLVLMMCGFLSSCATSPSYTFAREERELLPKDVAADFLNRRQLIGECQWSADSVVLRNGRRIRFDQYRLRWQVVEAQGSFGVYARLYPAVVSIGHFCRISSYIQGKAYRNERQVTNAVLALESLGFEPIAYNR